MGPLKSFIILANYVFLFQSFALRAPLSSALCQAGQAQPSLPWVEQDMPSKPCPRTVGTARCCNCLVSLPGDLKLTLFPGFLEVHTRQWGGVDPATPQFSPPPSSPRAWRTCTQHLWSFKMLPGESRELGKGGEDHG